MRHRSHAHSQSSPQSDPSAKTPTFEPLIYNEQLRAWIVQGIEEGRHILSSSDFNLEVFDQIEADHARAHEITTAPPPIHSKYRRAFRRALPQICPGRYSNEVSVPSRRRRHSISD